MKEINWKVILGQLLGMYGNGYSIKRKLKVILRYINRDKSQDKCYCPNCGHRHFMKFLQCCCGSKVCLEIEGDKK